MCPNQEIKKFIKSKKKKLYSKYESKFKNQREFYLLKELPDTKCNYWLITVILKKKNKNLLNKILKLPIKMDLIQDQSGNY